MRITVLSECNLPFSDANLEADESPAFVTRVVDIVAFVQAIFDGFGTNVFISTRNTVWMRVGLDKGGKTTKILLSFALRRLSNSPYSWFPLAIYTGTVVELVL